MEIGDVLKLTTFDYGFAETVKIIDKTCHGYQAEMTWNDGDVQVRSFPFNPSWIKHYTIIEYGPKSMLRKKLTNETI